MAAPPAWAARMVERICEEYGVDQPPTFTWRRARSRHYSSGMTYRNRIVVSAGTDPQDRRLVLLHELAHWIRWKTARDWGEAHSPDFWALAFQLYAANRVARRYALAREDDYAGARIAARTAARRRRGGSAPAREGKVTP